MDWFTITQDYRRYPIDDWTNEHYVLKMSFLRKYMIVYILNFIDSWFNTIIYSFYRWFFMVSVFFLCSEVANSNLPPLSLLKNGSNLRRATGGVKLSVILVSFLIYLNFINHDFLLELSEFISKLHNYCFYLDVEFSTQNDFNRWITKNLAYVDEPINYLHHLRLIFLKFINIIINNTIYMIFV